MREFCLGILTTTLNQTRIKDILTRSDPQNAVDVATLKKQIDELKQAAAKADKVQAKLNAALAESTNAMVALAKSLAEKAMDRPIVVK
jgi:hypothetical protein